MDLVIIHGRYIRYQRELNLEYYIPTDAIASAGGTTIKYVDTQTGVDVSGYGNILGAYITDAVGNIAIGLVPYRSNSVVLAFIAVNFNQIVVPAAGLINIRVFYY